jgi:hypothetical protein
MSKTAVNTRHEGTILGTWKMLGGIAILVPGFLRLKDPKLGRRRKQIVTRCWFAGSAFTDYFKAGGKRRAR